MITLASQPSTPAVSRARDMAVAAELAQCRRRPPQREVGLLGHG
ncbi:hypothetical protein ABZS88_12940 [Streptomyces sp. NPDC005480]